MLDNEENIFSINVKYFLALCALGIVLVYLSKILKDKVYLCRLQSEYTTYIFI